MGDVGERKHANAVIILHKYEPSAYDEPADGPVLTRIHVEESFSGDISGGGVVSSCRPDVPTGRLVSSGSNGSPARWAAARARSCYRIRARSRTTSSAVTGSWSRGQEPVAWPGFAARAGSVRTWARARRFI